jgi:hypothetical protein
MSREFWMLLSGLLIGIMMTVSIFLLIPLEPQLIVSEYCGPYRTILTPIGGGE